MSWGRDGRRRKRGELIGLVAAGYANPKAFGAKIVIFSIVGFSIPFVAAKYQLCVSILPALHAFGLTGAPGTNADPSLAPLPRFALARLSHYRLSTLFTLPQLEGLRVDANIDIICGSYEAEGS